LFWLSAHFGFGFNFGFDYLKISMVFGFVLPSLDHTLFFLVRIEKGERKNFHLSLLNSQLSKTSLAGLAQPTVVGWASCSLPHRRIKGSVSERANCEADEKDERAADDCHR